MSKKVFKIPYVGTDTDREKGISILYTQNGDYSVIIKCQNPILQFSADMESYYGFHTLYGNIVKTLGANYTVQKQDIFTKKEFNGAASGDFLSEKYNGHFQGRKFTEITTHLSITKTIKRSAFFTYDHKDYQNFLRDIEKVIEILDAKNLFPVLLDEKAIKSYLKNMLSFSFNGSHVALNNFSCNDEKINLGDDVVKCITLVDIDEIDLPSSTKPYRDSNDLGYSFPVDTMNFLHSIPGYESLVYNQVISIPDQQVELSKLRAKRRKHESIPDPANELSVNDIDALLSDVAKSSQMIVHGHFNIVIKAKAEDINRATNYIESALFNVGITPSKNAYNQLELFRTCLPGNTGELKHYDKFLTTSDAAICFLFKERLVTDEDSKFKIYFTDRQGIPVAIDTSDLPMETNRINNRNMFVLGPSGSGKSFFMNHLVRQYFLYNMDIILVDTGHSYSGLCEYYGGRYITYSEERPITMNPFRINPEEYNEEKRENLKSLIGLLWKGADGSLNQIEDSVLATVVASYYKDYFSKQNKDLSYLSFNTFYDFSVDKISEIIQKEGIPFDLREYQFILKKFYKGGEYESILNSDVDSSLFDESFIVFEIDAIKEHKILFPITTLIIMDVFLQKMRHKKNRKALIIEEAWKAIASPLMAGYILYLYKTVRKFWGLATVVTQELDDIIGNAIVKDSIISNSDTICLLDQTKFRDNYDSVSKLLSLNDIEKNKIFTVNNLPNKSGRSRFKEVYIRRGASGEVYGVEVSIFEYLTYTTERKEKDALKVYVDRYGFRTGLERFVSDFKSSKKSLSSFVDSINKSVTLNFQLT